jgi:hypothetical protein
MPQIQIFPMSDSYLARGQTIGHFFTRDLVTVSAHRPTAGRFNFKSQGVTAPPGSLLLFQYGGRLVAHAELLAQHDPDGHSPPDSRGFFLLDLSVSRYYLAPIQAVQLHRFWPGLAFNQRKHKLDNRHRLAFLAFANTR